MISRSWHRQMLGDPRCVRAFMRASVALVDSELREILRVRRLGSKWLSRKELTNAAHRRAVQFND